MDDIQHSGEYIRRSALGLVRIQSNLHSQLFGRYSRSTALLPDLFQGYGLVYPSVSVSTGGRCVAFNFFTTFEAFIGILYGAIAGAILFGKISRVSSFANVAFSEPVLVRFGKGLKETGITSHSAFPILEFRILNRMHDRDGGEILNASVTCVAVVDESMASKGMRVAAAGGNKRRRRHRRIAQQPARSDQLESLRDSQLTDSLVSEFGLSDESLRLSSTQQDEGPESVTDPSLRISSLRSQQQGTANASSPPSTTAVPVDSQEAKAGSNRKKGPLPKISFGNFSRPSFGLSGRNRSTGSAETRQSFRPGRRLLHKESTIDSKAANEAVRRIEERTRAGVVDEGSPYAPRQIFSPFFVETPSHPFFKRVWIVRHRLDATSPFLKAKTKRLIAKNHGRWPRQLNTWKKIKESIQFSQILCSFSGTSNSTGNSVFNQKMYTPEDMVVGYTFARILHQHPTTEALHVREEFLNDVHVQTGGGGEPLDEEALLDEDEIDEDPQTHVFREAAGQIGAVAGAAGAAAGAAANGVLSVATAPLTAIQGGKAYLRRRTAGTEKGDGDDQESSDSASTMEGGNTGVGNAAAATAAHKRV